jgi:hypothetical protein
VRAQLVAHGPLNTNGAALPIETGAELQIGPTPCLRRQNPKDPRIWASLIMAVPSWDQEGVLCGLAIVQRLQLGYSSEFSKIG